MFDCPSCGVALPFGGGPCGVCGFSPKENQVENTAQAVEPEATPPEEGVSDDSVTKKK